MATSATFTVIRCANPLCRPKVIAEINPPGRGRILCRWCKQYTYFDVQ